MTLRLERSLLGLDTETTGTNTRVDRVVQIGVVKLYPSGETKKWKQLVQPGVAIPPEATAIHGITDEMVRDAPRFKELAPTLAVGFRDCDITGYNVRFDIRMLLEEFKRAGFPVDGILDGLIVDPSIIFRQRERRSLVAAMKFYLDLEFSEEAHDALADVEASIQVLEAQIKRYGLPETVSEIAAACDVPPEGWLDPDGKLVWKYGEAVVNFGQYAGERLRSMDQGWLSWVLAGDFSRPMKAIVQEAMNGRYPERKA